jgi:hypothetical protein
MGFLILAIAAVGCGAPPVTTPTSEPTAPVRPNVPEGWSIVTSDEGDVEMALPPDFSVVSSAGGILAQPPIVEQGGAISMLEVSVQGPALIEQPRGGESVTAWLERAFLLPRPGEGGITEVADRAERRMMLPSGRAVEVAVTAQPGTEDESRVVVYAIETSDGIAVLRLIGFPPRRLDERASDLILLVNLVRFGADLGD